MTGEGDPRVGSGRGGTLGTGGQGDQPEQLRPDRGEEDEKFVVSGGGLADTTEDEETTDEWSVAAYDGGVGMVHRRITAPVLGTCPP